MRWKWEVRPYLAISCLNLPYHAIPYHSGRGPSARFPTLASFSHGRVRKRGTEVVGVDDVVENSDVRTDDEMAKAVI